MNIHTLTSTHMQISCSFWYMQSDLRTHSHILLDNTAWALLNDAHIWKTSNQYFFFFFSFLFLRKNKETSKGNTKPEEGWKIFSCYWLWLYISVESCGATMVSWLFFLLLITACLLWPPFYLETLCVRYPSSKSNFSVCHLNFPPQFFLSCNVHRKCWFPLPATHTQMRPAASFVEVWMLRSRSKRRWEEGVSMHECKSKEKELLNSSFYLFVKADF